MIPGGKFDTKRDENDKTLPWKGNTNIGPGSYPLPMFLGNKQVSVSRVSNSRTAVIREPISREKGSLSADRSKYSLNSKRQFSNEMVWCSLGNPAVGPASYDSSGKKWNGKELLSGKKNSFTMRIRPKSTNHSRIDLSGKLLCLSQWRRVDLQRV